LGFGWESWVSDGSLLDYVFWTIAALILKAMVFTLPYFAQKYQYAMETVLFFLHLLNHTELNLSHGICPECLKKKYIGTLRHNERQTELLLINLFYFFKSNL
jgi:hypothetical protein